MCEVIQVEGVGREKRIKTKNKTKNPITGSHLCKTYICEETEEPKILK